MHSSRELTSQMFQVEEAGRPVASFAGLCPGFTALDRLGVIVRKPLAATLNSAFILSAVTAFYDEQRKCHDELFIYPDYFVFHVGCEVGDYSMFDIWPQHKCLHVDDDPEAIARAINDRGVSILLLAHAPLRRNPEREAALQQHTHNSALARIKYAFTAATAGLPEAITITGNEVVERYVESVLEANSSIKPEQDEFTSRRAAAGRDQSSPEWYVRLTVESALQLL